MPVLYMHVLSHLRLSLELNEQFQGEMRGFLNLFYFNFHAWRTSKTELRGFKKRESERRILLPRVYMGTYLLIKHFRFRFWFHYWSLQTLSKHRRLNLKLNSHNFGLNSSSGRNKASNQSQFKECVAVWQTWSYPSFS